jgi:hypothetical protein
MTDIVSRLELISHLNKMIDLCIKDEVDKLEPYVIALHARFPDSPEPVSGPNVKLNPKVNHITLKIANPKKIYMNIETVFFFRSNPASNIPRAGFCHCIKDKLT